MVRGKTIVLGAAIASGLLGTTLYSFACKMESKVQPVLRMAQSGYVSEDRIDPAKIVIVEEYNLVWAIYSPLLEYNNEGQIVGALAERFYWEDNDLVFELRPNHLSSKGDVIDARDVELSLKRILVLGSNTHGNLKQVLCGQNDLESLTSPCPGIEVIGPHKLVLHFDKRRHYIVPMFTNMDFAIIPKAAIDHKTLEIIDHRNSSGPYQIVSSNDVNKEIILKSRKDHWLISDNSPHDVHIKVLMHDDGREFNSLEKVEAIESNLIDVLPTFGFFDSNSALELVRKNNLINLFKTHDIAVAGILFSTSGVERSSPAQRRQLGRIFRHKMANYFAGPNSIRRPSFEYFPRTGAGQLTDADFHELQALLSTSDDSVCNTEGFKKFRIAVHPQSYSLALKIYGEVGECHELVSVSDPASAVHGSGENQIDARITITDVSFNEDLSLLFYTESVGSFPYGKKANAEWLETYLMEEDKPKRLEMMSKLHKDMLLHSAFIPLASMPYLALSRAPWKLHFSDTMAGSPLWQIKYEP